MIQVGVGLRSAHYEAAMTPASIDFVEVHAENFFAEGGVTHDLLMSVTEHYKISLHGTSLGLGSLQPPPFSLKENEASDRKVLSFSHFRSCLFQLV